MAFSRFMELALYHPEHGYYAAGKAEIGRAGDFYTSVSVGSVFAGMICQQAEQAWECLGRPTRFWFVERGAHDGTFAADFLAWAIRYEPEFAEALHYVIAEPFHAQRSRQQEALGAYRSHISWIESPDELPSHEGMHFGNEVIDALPFDLFVREKDNWLERRVALLGGDLRFEETSTDETFDWPVPPITPFTRERRVGVDAFLAASTANLEQGLLLFADYGHPADAFNEEFRREGTATAYRSHRRVDDLLADPGEQDLTAHVDFTELANCGIATGLQLAGYTDQHHFLVGAGESWMRAMEGIPTAAKQLRTLTTLLHPETMGRSFKFLGLWKSDPTPTLSGFRYAKPAASALGIPTEAE